MCVCLCVCVCEHKLNLPNSFPMFSHHFHVKTFKIYIVSVIYRYIWTRKYIISLKKKNRNKKTFSRIPCQNMKSMSEIPR